MKNKKNVKSKDAESYKKVVFEQEKTLVGRELRRLKKRPTSIALDEETIEQLKELALEKGIPYQVLMRSYIIQGIKKDKKSA
jgi:predicted DNA binding CopG/RHH family protein